MKKQLLCLFVLSLLFVSCATSPQLMNMVPHIPTQSLYHSNKTLKIGEVIGGEESDPMWKGSRIDAISFKGALLVALQNAAIFPIVDANQISNYSLNVMLLSQEQPAIGLDMTSTLFVRYYLIDEATKQEIWSKDIRSVYTAKLGDSLVGATRLNMADRKSVV